MGRVFTLERKKTVDKIIILFRNPRTKINGLHNDDNENDEEDNEEDNRGSFYEGPSSSKQSFL